MIIARLAVLAGPDLGAEFQIGADGGAIGRGAGCAVKLTDPAASRTHAVLAVREGVLHLRDEGGPNPTLVNGSPHGDGALRDGDRVRVGQTTLIVLPPEGGLVPLAEPGRTLNTLELGADGRGSIEAALIELAAQWRRAPGPTEVARAACRVARELFGGRRAVVLSPDAAGRLVAAACAPESASGAVAIGEADVAAVRGGRAIAVSTGGIVACVAACASGILVVEAPAEPERSLSPLAALAALTGAQLDASVAGERSERARRVLAERTAPTALVGKSQALDKILKRIDRVAPTDATVLISGESGTGKELIAEALHARSPRARGPFVAINCAALTDSLLESELFGHERGAFTGAVERRAGRFEQADGGTLFLDELGELSEACQAKLLRVLETRRFERIGGARTLAVDVRVIAATHRDLQERVRDGAFREDLFYRICVVRIDVPPLRERPDDILPLAESFLARTASALGRPFSGFTAAAQQLLEQHAWPGNARELRNAVERAAIMAEGPQLDAGDLDELGLREVPTTMKQSLDQHEREALRRALDETGGNKAAAAELLGIDRTTLYKKLRRLGLS